MAQTVSKIPVMQKKRSVSSPSLQPWEPLESLHRQIDRLIDDFGRGVWQPFRHSLFGAEPLWPRAVTWGAAFQLPTSFAPDRAPNSMSESRAKPRHMTMFPGGHHWRAQDSLRASRS
ncbi:MAG: hypothetical protein P8Y71_20550 [Pseudolabrys sp.]